MKTISRKILSPVLALAALALNLSVLWEARAAPAGCRAAFGRPYEMQIELVALTNTSAMRLNRPDGRGVCNHPQNIKEFVTRNGDWV